MNDYTEYRFLVQVKGLNGRPDWLSIGTLRAKTEQDAIDRFEQADDRYVGGQLLAIGYSGDVLTRVETKTVTTTTIVRRPTSERFTI